MMRRSLVFDSNISLPLLFSMAPYKDLARQMANAAGWKESWLPRKLETISQDLSARAHSGRYWKERIQGGNITSVILSAKVLPSKSDQWHNLYDCARGICFNLCHKVVSLFLSLLSIFSTSRGM